MKQLQPFSNPRHALIAVALATLPSILQQLPSVLRELPPVIQAWRQPSAPQPAPAAPNGRYVQSTAPNLPR